MGNIWSTEAWAIAIASLALLLLGLLGGNWLIASLFTLCSYIGWLYYRLLKLERWIRKGTRISEVPDDNGFIGIIIRLLHQQKKVHNQRKRRTKRILRRLNRNISALPDATVLLKRDLQIEWCNEPARYLLNLRSPQDIGTRITNLIRDPDFLAYLQDLEGRDFIEIESPNDPSISIQVKVVAFGGGQFLLIARNISDQKRLQQSLKNFVANASHELKSPLTVISGHLEMLDSESKLSESGRRSLQIAERQTGRMQELIEGLLLLSQVESYRLGPDEGDQIEIAEMMINVMAALEKYPDRDRIELHCADGLYLLGIRTEIEGICLNLVENALKYTSPGTPVRVDWLKNATGELVFRVEDQGPGIDAQDLPRITDRYFRGARSRAESTGSGLGLAIVKHAASKHGARFDIDSEAARGSRFRVSFPSYRSLDGVPERGNIIGLENF